MEWWMYLIIGLVAFIALVIIFKLINKSFIRKYGFSLYGGGILLLIAIACVGGGILGMMNEMGVFAYVLMGIGAIPLIFTLIYDFKKCGGAGILAFILQLIFCIPSIIVVVDLIFNRGRSTVFNSSAYAEYADAHREYRKNNRD